MDLIRSDDGDFQEVWKQFASNAHNVSWRYLPRWMDYQRIYAGSRLMKDLSFILVDGEGPAALCPLFLEKLDAVSQLSMAGGYQPMPLAHPRRHYRQKKKILHACFKEIDRLAREHNASKALFVADPLAEKYGYNALAQFGCLDTSGCSVILDLSADLRTLWAELRKSYKALIKSGQKAYEIVIMDYTCPNRRIHEAYRELHHKTAGRITRPQETFDIMYDMLKNDNALLVGLKKDNTFVGFSYFLHVNGKTFYGSASDDPDFDGDVPLEHTILWSAVEYFRNRGFSELELGFQVFGPQVFQTPSPKEINISFFKRGFGGTLRTVFTGIKYYDRAFLRRELQSRVSTLSEEYEIE